jgi:[acyl-carrier-protein] S-malonyltransferase
MVGMEKGVAAVVFPGQGSQRSGMGKDFYEKIPVSRETYDEASHAVGWDIAVMCFGDDERLNLTEFTQPCILTTEIAMLRGLQSLFGFSPAFFGGHSLGEFTALVAAGVLPLAAAVQIVQIRGRLMQEAVPVGMGAMAAIIYENIDVNLMQRILQDMPLDLANINSANQVVISGKAEAISEAESKLEDLLAKEKPLRYVPLNVSAPFHSRFMEPIVEPFKKALLSINEAWDAGRATAVTSNFTGRFHSGRAEDVVDNLVFQLNHAVQWVDNMKNLALRADKIYEVGPSRPLRDFFRTIDIICSSITTLSSAERLFGVKNRG